jgi:hypothetical protein
MPPTPRANSPFDKYEATLDELAGVGRNHQFDAIVDGEEDKRIEVVCRRSSSYWVRTNVMLGASHASAD